MMYKNPLPAPAALLAAIALTTIAAGPVSAQGAAGDSIGQLEEIVVTAQKREESLQDVPLSIMAVTGETLEDAGIRNPVDLGKLVPSLQINNGLFSAGVIVRIRGFGSASNSAVDSDVASYLDSAFVPRPGAILGSFLDVKNVEVLSGPQGTLFGRNAAMGAISINTNAPSTEARTINVKVEGANYGSYSATGVANLPANDRLAFRIAASTSSTDGIYKNLFDGKTYGQRDETVGRVSMKWNIADNVSWTVRADAANTDGDGAFPQTVHVDTATPAALAALAAYNTAGGGTAQVYSSNPSYTFNQALPNPYLDDKQFGITSDLNWSLSSVLTARFISSYRDWDSKQQAANTPQLSLDLLSVELNATSKAQSHELQLISSKNAYMGEKLGFTAGLYFSTEAYQLNTTFNAGTRFCPVVLAAMAALIPACQAAPQAGAGLVFFDQDADTYAGYVQANFQLAPSLQLDLGARYTSDEKSADYRSVQQNSFAVGQIVGTEGPYALGFDDKNTSVRASLAWHATDDVMAFATYSTGYKSGGFNSGGSVAPLPPNIRTFESETVDDIEVGLKSTFWDGRFRLNATLFDTKLNNFQDRSFNGTSFVIRNSGDVKSRGLDLDGQVLATSNLRFSYGATWLDSKYASNVNAPSLEGCPATGSPTCPRTQDLSGRTLAFAPDLHGNVGFQWISRPFANGYSAAFSASQNFTSSFLTASTLNPQSRVDGYATTDMLLSLRPSSERWQLELFGTNVFDKHYYVSTVAQVLGAAMGVNNVTTGTTLYRGFLGDPARFGIRLSASF